MKGADKIEDLILNQTMPTKRKMSAKMFEKLSKLRLLEIFDTSDIKGNFKNSFSELRCIRWRSAYGRVYLRVFDHKSLFVLICHSANLRHCGKVPWYETIILLLI